MAKQLMTFFVDRLWCGVDVAKAQEVVTFEETTPVPLAPTEVVGLANLRGRIVAVLDLRRLLELEAREGGASGHGVVLTGPSESIALLVDRAGGVVTVSQGDFEPPPETLRGSLREKILGAFKLAEGLLLELNLERLLQVSVRR